MKFEKVPIATKSNPAENAEDIEVLETPEDDTEYREKYEKELLPLIKLLKPKYVGLDEYEHQLVSELFDDVKHIQAARGVLLDSPEKTFKEAKEVLLSRIRAVVADAADYDKVQKMDYALVRRARTALLQEGDFSDMRRYAGPKDPKDYDFETIRNAILRGRLENKLDEEEVDALVKAGFGKKIASSQYYEITDYIKGVPESLLMELIRAKIFNIDTTIKFALNEGASKNIYSENAAKALIVNGYSSLVFENIDKFENVDFEDVVIGMKLRRWQSMDTLTQELSRNKSKMSDSEFEERVSTIVKHTYRERELKQRSPLKAYEKIIKEAEQVRYANGEIVLDDITKKNIEDGYIGFYRDKIADIARDHYDWLIKVAEKNDQELLLSNPPYGAESLLKPEDQLVYAKKILGGERAYMSEAFLSKKQTDKIFSAGVLDQEVFDGITKYTRDLDLTLFKDLDEKSLEMMQKEHPEYFEDVWLVHNIESFKFEENNSKFESFKKYQKIIESVRSYFSPDEPRELYWHLGLDFEKVKDSNLEELDALLLKKSAVFRKVREIFFKNPGANKHYFVSHFGPILQETAEDMEKMSDQIPFLPLGLTDKPAAYREGLKALSECDEQSKDMLIKDAAAIYEGRELFKSGEEEIFLRYFKTARGVVSEEELRTCIGDIPGFVIAYKKMTEIEKEFWNKVFPWAPTLEKIEGLQGTVVRAEYDPWKTQFIPLLLKDESISLSNPEDGKIILEYFSRFGMKNLPETFSLFKDVYKAKDVDGIPEETKRILKEAFGVDVIELCKKDKSNIKLVLSEIQKIVPKVISGLRNESLITTSIAESPYALEILASIVGDSGHNHGVSTAEAIKIYKKALMETPEKFVLPDEYKEVEILVPEIVINDDEEKNEKIKSEREKLLNNPDLRSVLDSHSRALVESTTVLDGSLPIDGVKDFFLEKIRGIEENLSKEGIKDEAVFGLKKRLEQYKLMQKSFIEQIELLNDHNETAINKMEAIFKTVPDDYVDKKHLMMTLSLRDIDKKMPNGFSQFLIGQRPETSMATKINTAYEFLSNNVKEHYLDKKHGEKEAIGTKNKDLIKALKKYWGVQEFEKSILSISNERLKALDRGELSGKSKKISLVPSKGLQRIFSGDIGKACTSNQNRRLAEGQFENLVSYSLVIDKDTVNEKFVGSFIVIESKTESGEQALILRANNPQQNLFNMVDGDSLIQSIIDEVKALAKRRKIGIVVAPFSGGATTNRPEVSKYYAKKYTSKEKVQLENNPETNFNNYDIWRSESGNAVVEI